MEEWRVLQSGSAGFKRQTATFAPPGRGFCRSAPGSGDPRQHRGPFDNCEIRIDYVQHNISALLGLREILLAQAGSKAALCAA